MEEPPGPLTATQSGWGAQSRASEDLEYFTELALQETQHWIEGVTQKRFKYDDDFRGSLDDGILLCELLNGLRPATIRKINRLPTPIAGLDNINVFLEACQTHFGLKDSQLFHSCDLEDLSTRAVSDSEDQLKQETERRLRNVAITIFWLGKVCRKYNFHGPQLDLSVFSNLLHRGASSRLHSPPATPSIPSASPSVENISHQWALSASTPTTPSLSSTTPSLTPSSENVSLTPGGAEITPDESTDSIDRSSAYGSFRSEAKNSLSSDTLDDVLQGQNKVEGHVGHTKQDSYESFVSDRSVTSDYHEESSPGTDYVNMPVRYGDGRLGRYSASLDTTYDPNQSAASSTTSPSNNNDHDKMAADDPYQFRNTPRTPSQNSLDKMVKENDMLNTRLGLKKASSVGHPNAMQFVKTGGVKELADSAKETATVMAQQKEMKKSFELMDDDWSSNLSSWKSKMRKKSSGSLQRTQDSLDMEQEEGIPGAGKPSDGDDGVTRRKSKTFKEMMEERENRKSGSYTIYPLDDSDDSAFSSQGSKGRQDNDDKLSMFGFHKVDEPAYSPRSPRSPPASSSGGRTIFDSRHYDGAQTGAGYGAGRHAERFSTADKFSVSSAKPSVAPPGGRSSEWPQTVGDQDKSDNIEVLERLTTPRAKGGHQAWSWERRSTSIVDDEPTKEEVAAWALDDDDQSTTTTNEHQSKAGKAEFTESHRKIDSDRLTESSKILTSRTQDHQVREIPVTLQKSESPPKEASVGFKSARSMFERPPVQESRSLAVQPPRKIGIVHEPPRFTSPKDNTDVVVTRTVKKSYEFSKQETDKPSTEWSRKQSTERTERTAEFLRSPSKTSHTQQKDHIEKVIKISQKPDHEKGFGFTIRGGKEYASPIMVEKVVLDFTDPGGAADVCELMPGDEIVAVNGALVANHYLGSVQMVIDQAVKAGQIELRIRRGLDKAKLGLFDEEEFQMEQEQERLLHVEQKRVNTRLETPGERTDQRVLPPWEVDRINRNEGETQKTPPAETNGQRVNVPWERQEHVVSPSRDQFDLNVEKNYSRPELEIGQQSHKINVSHHHTTDLHQPEQVPASEEPRVSSPESVSSLEPDGPDLLDHVDIQQQQSYQTQPLRAPAGFDVTDTPDANEESSDADEPPPLPSAPPPAPNWNTFPGAAPSTAPSDLSLLNSGDLVPEVSKSEVTEQGDLEVRLEKLKRKAEFLGQNYQDTEEYRKLMEEMERASSSEDDHWQKIEQQEHLRASNLMSRFDQIPKHTPVTMDTSVTNQTKITKDTNHMITTETKRFTMTSTPVTMDTSVTLNTKPRDLHGYNDSQSEKNNNRSVYGYNKDDQETIARLERSEHDRQERVGELDRLRREEDRAIRASSWTPDEMRSWRSMEMLRGGTAVKVQVSEDDLHARTSRDMESLLSAQPKLDVQPSRRFFDLGAEQERMRRWMEEQERKLQEKFERDQESIQQEKEEALRRAQETGNKNKEQEEKLLEKELARQRELEEIKRKRDEDRHKRHLQDEAERKERERKEEIAFRKRVQKEEAERRQRQQQEDEERRLRQQKEETERRIQQKREEAERRAEQKKREEAMLEQREKERLRLERERLEQQEAELRAKEEELRSLEAEKKKRIDEEQQRRREELRRYEEEQRRKEAEERQDEDAIRTKERELRKLEERLKAEEEKLRLQKEQFQREQEQGGYRSDKVTVTYNAPVILRKGEAEYVYQHEAAPPQELESSNELPDSRALTTERTEQFEVRSAPPTEVTHRLPEADSGSPVVRRIIKREPLIPPKQGIKTELSGLSRRDILDMNKKPAGQQRGFDDSYQVSPSQARRRMEQQAFRKSWSPDVLTHELSASPERPANGAYSQARATGMSREEVMSANRKAFAKKEFTPEREMSPHDKSPSPPSGPSMTKRTLHNLGAAPKPRLIGSQTWIREEPKRGARRSEVVRSSLGTLSEHWLVEEAERRRVAEQTGQERVAYPNRQEHPYLYGESDVADNMGQPGSDPDILAPPQGYQMSRLSRSWQGSREQTPSRISPSRSVGGWEGTHRESPQRSQFSYSQKASQMSTFRAPTRVTEVDKPEIPSKPQRPIPADIKQSLIDRVNTPRDSYASSQSYPSPSYPYSQPPSSPPYAQSSPSSQRRYADQQSPKYQDRPSPPYHNQQSPTYHNQPSPTRHNLPGQFQYPAQVPYTGPSDPRQVQVQARYSDSRQPPTQTGQAPPDSRQSHPDQRQSHLDQRQSHLDQRQSHLDQRQSHQDPRQSHHQPTYPDSRQSHQQSPYNQRQPNTQPGHPEHRLSNVDTRQSPQVRRESPQDNRQYPQDNRQYPQDTRQYPQDTGQYPQDTRQYPQDTRQSPPDPRQLHTQAGYIDARQSNPDLRQSNPDLRQSNPDLRHSQYSQREMSYSHSHSQSLPQHYSSNQARPQYNNQSPRHVPRPRESPPEPPSHRPQHTAPHMHNSTTHTGHPTHPNTATPGGSLHPHIVNLQDRPPSSSGSIQSTERAPPVPPKPPRLLSTSSEESAEQVVSLV